MAADWRQVAVAHQGLLLAGLQARGAAVQGGQEGQEVHRQEAQEGQVRGEEGRLACLHSEVKCLKYWFYFDKRIKCSQYIGRHCERI